MMHLFLTSALDVDLPALRPRRPLNRKLGGPHSRYSSFGKEVNVLPLKGIEPDSSVVQTVA